MKIKVTGSYETESIVDTEDPNFKLFCERDMRFRVHKQQTVEDLAIGFAQRYWGWANEGTSPLMLDWKAEKEE